MNSEANVVLVGRTGSGKRTVANQFAGKNVFEAAKSSLAASLRSATCIDASVFSTALSGLNLNVRAIDSCGVDEIISAYSVKKSITSFAEKCGGLHLILFVLTLSDVAEENGLDEKHLLDVAQCLEKKMYSHCAIVVTHCDGMNEEAKKQAEKKIIMSSVGQRLGLKPERVFCVTFPLLANLSQVKRNMLKEEFEASTKLLQDFVKKCGRQQAVALQKESWWQWLCHYVPFFEEVVEFVCYLVRRTRSV